MITVAVMLLPVTAGGDREYAQTENGDKEWTLMMYWVADNNLEFCTEFALATWESALTDDTEINLIAMIDILSKPGTWIYEVSGGSSEIVKTYDELNTSDPETLEDFLDYGLANYPANKVMLVMQDHGFSWRGSCSDETDGDSLLPMDGLAKALENARETNGGKGIDLLVFDACSMASLEVVYELRNAVSYVVASQSVVPYDGMPYELMVSGIVEYPEITPEELAEDIVYDYVEYYSDQTTYDHIYPYNQDYSTVSAFRMSDVPALGSAFIGFTETLLPLIEHHQVDVMAARSAALIGIWANMGGYEWLPDMCKFMEGLTGALSDDLDLAIESFMVAYEAALVTHAHSPQYDGRAYGINFWFPPSVSQYDSCSWFWAQQFDYDESGLDIVEESSWTDCLFAYYDKDTWGAIDARYGI